MNGQSLPEAAVAAIKATIESFTRCLEAGEFQSWVSHWAEDGVLMPPGRPCVIGHEALVEFIRKEFGNIQSFTLSNWTIFGEDGLAVATTNVQWTTGPNQPPSEAMKQVIVLIKDAGGKWLLKTIMFNAGV